MKKKIIIFGLTLFFLSLETAFFFKAKSTIVADKTEKEIFNKMAPQEPKVEVLNQILPLRHVAETSSQNRSEAKASLAAKFLQQRSIGKKKKLTQYPEKLIAHFLLIGTNWKVWPGTRAILTPQLSAADSVLAELSRFSIVEFPNAEASLDQFDRNVPPVVYDARLKRAGIVTGLLKVETDRKDLLEESLPNLNSYISNSFENIQTYFVTSRQDVFDLESLFKNLKSQQYVKSIELDILDRNYEKK